MNSANVSSLLDLPRLEAFLLENGVIRGAITAATKFPGGQSNPTFKLEADGHQFVLRKQPPGQLLPSAHAVDREYRVLSALSETDVPVPRPLFYCGDRDIIGTPFYIMERLRGRVFWSPTLPELDKAERHG